MAWHVCCDHRKVNGHSEFHHHKGFNLTKGYNSVRLLDKIISHLDLTDLCYGAFV